MTKEKVEIGKSYKLNKTIGIDKCGSKLFVKGAVVKAISYGYGFAIELNHFIWRPSLEDLDEIEEESNESNVDKLLALRYVTLRKKFTKWNCKIMKENKKGKLK